MVFSQLYKTYIAPKTHVFRYKNNYLFQVAETCTQRRLVSHYSATEGEGEREFGWWVGCVSLIFGSFSTTTRVLAKDFLKARSEELCKSVQVFMVNPWEHCMYDIFKCKLLWLVGQVLFPNTNDVFFAWFVSICFLGSIVPLQCAKSNLSFTCMVHSFKLLFSTQLPEHYF